MHDYTVDRTTNGTGTVSDMTLAQIKALDAGNGQKVPTLDEILTKYKYTVNYFIETKKIYDPEMDTELIRLLEKHALIGRYNREGKVTIQSFSEESLKSIHSKYPTIRKVRLSDYLAGLDYAAIKNYAYGIGTRYGNLSKEIVDDIHSNGLTVHPFTVNTKSEIETIVSYGVDGIISNYPDTVNQVILTGV